MRKNLLLILLVFLIVFSESNAQWQSTYGPTGFAYQRVLCFAQIGSTYFCGTQADGVWKSTDNSSSDWIKVNNGLTNVTVNTLLVIGADLFAGTAGGVFKTSNSGQNWSSLNNGLSNTSVSSMAVIGSNLFVSTFGGGVFRSTDNGSSWTAVNNGLSSNWIDALTTIGSNVFAASSGFGSSGVYVSTDNGSNWNTANFGLNVFTVMTITSNGLNLFAVTKEGSATRVFVSTNNGTNWILANTGLPEGLEKCFAVSGTNIFAGAYDQGVFLSTNNGTNWVAVNEGFGTSRTIRCLGILGTDLFAGFYGYSVKRRPLSDFGITAVNDVKDLPANFSLSQNFPNPFNPSTRIQYQVSSITNVSLKVYDILGNEAATLVNEQKPAGIYEVEFDANQLTSGIYFYKLQAGSFVEAKKMILIQ